MPAIKPVDIAAVTPLVVATLAGYLLIPPGRDIAVRWGLDGSVTATAPMLWGLMQMPAAAAIIWLLIWLVGRYGNSERDPVRQRTLDLAPRVLSLVLGAVQIAIVWFGR